MTLVFGMHLSMKLEKLTDLTMTSCRVSTPGWWGGIPSHSPASVLSISCHLKENFATFRLSSILIGWTSGCLQIKSMMKLHGTICMRHVEILFPVGQTWDLCNQK